jgi:hypothetical protein
MKIQTFLWQECQDFCEALAGDPELARQEIQKRITKLILSKRRSNPPSQAAEPVVKCGHGASDERSHGKTTDPERDSADCGGVCNERHATE